MRILGACRLVDVLAQWGSHNTKWRIGRAVTDAADAVEVALTYYAQLVGSVLAVEPLACLRAELGAADVPNLVAVNGREKMAHWAVGRAQDPGHAGGYIRRMVQSTEPVVGPLVCACAGEVTVGADDQFDVRVQPPFVVFDGCHRCAGWVGHGQAGWTYPIAAMLIVTKKAP